MVFHSGILPGGWLGVDVFFALSGFLITSLLLEEYGRTGRIDLGHFYVRRLLRLLPALLLCVGVIGTILFVLRPDRRGALAVAVAAVLLYVANWALVLGANLGSFGHTWSLGIEEQFYILWPLLLLVLLRHVRRLPAIVLLVGAMAALSAGGRLAIAWSGAMDPFVTRRLFAGLDFRADSLLVGCALAALW